MSSSSSKKKASTMTLKDFHGGTIPSDLPLPSAPGVVVRPSDRQIAAASIGRSDQYQYQHQHQRSRPAVAAAASNHRYDNSNEKSSFFPHPPHIGVGIGRNFDEDERKPLDGSSLPRRTVSDDLHPPSSNPHPARRSHDPAINPPNANPWGTTTTTNKDSTDLLHSSISTSTSTSRFAQATALDKVSSGRWQSKPPVIQQPPPPPPPQPNKPLLLTNQTTLLLLEHNDHTMPPAPLDRPKIKLLPRSRSSLQNTTDQAYQPPSANELPPSAATDGTRKPVERPRLNLKPRSQPLQQSHGIILTERKSLFGGARPRELVLKERGVDEVVINNLDVIQPPNSRVNDEQHETKKQDPEAAECEQRVRGSWRNENWRRGESEATWRKAVEEEQSGVRYGKAASALELAQAFSGSRTTQVPFSRLTDTREFYSSPATPRRQINGY